MYLIDGYNLLHALGLLHGRTGPTGLEKARRNLLGLLRGALGPGASAVTVVFDAAQAPPGVPDQFVDSGITVHFAVRHAQADDLIAELIQHDSAPRSLTLVSDDHQVQQAARRRHCIVLGCDAFLDELARQRRQRRRPAQETEKANVASAADTQHWLAAFADLADDPDLHELFDPFDFGRLDPETREGPGAPGPS